MEGIEVLHLPRRLLLCEEAHRVLLEQASDAEEVVVEVDARPLHSEHKVGAHVRVDREPAYIALLGDSQVVETVLDKLLVVLYEENVLPSHPLFDLFRALALISTCLVVTLFEHYHQVVGRP